MQLFSLQTSIFGATPSTLFPSDIIEGYHSLIWTERFLSDSEFELKTFNIEAMMAKLPIGTVLSHSTTDKMMIVENWDVSPDDETGADVLTVTGRGFETILEQRASLQNLIPEYGPGPDDVQQVWLTPSYDSGLAAAFIIASILRSSHPSVDDLVGGTQAYYTTGNTDTAIWQVPRQDLYATARDLANVGGFGLKAVYDFTDPSIPIHFVVYKGVDKSATVQLSVKAGHFVKPSYLWSNKSYKNVAYVFGRHAMRVVYSPEYAGGVYDLDRRVLLVNATDIQDVDSPATQALLLTRGNTELAKCTMTFMFGGQVSPSIPYKYGYNYQADYGLGDKILVIANYGVKQLMLVTEYIRTEDKTGEFGSPTLVQIPSS